MRNGGEYPHTNEFLMYAASSCGTPAIPRGKHETIASGSDLTLEPISPAPVHYRRKAPPFVVRLYAVRAAKAAVESECDKLFEGVVVESSQRTMRRGDVVIGLASPESPALVVNTSNTEDMSHLLETYNDSAYRRQVVL